MLTGVCTGDFTLTADGLDFLETGVMGLLCPREPEEAFAARLAAARAASRPVMAANGLVPREIPLTGPAVDQAAVDQYMRTALSRAAKAGLRVVVFGSGAARKVPDGFSHAQATSQIVAHLKRWGDMAAAGGITLVVEPLHRGETNIINSVAEGAEVVRAAGHGSVWLLADTFHMAKENEGPDAIVKAGGLIRHVHCADPDGRVPLGFASADHRPYFRALKQVGYAGGVSIEASWKDQPAQVAQALAALRKQIAEA